MKMSSYPVLCELIVFENPPLDMHIDEEHLLLEPLMTATVVNICKCGFLIMLTILRKV
jgi:hypothetical protein